MTTANPSFGPSAGAEKSPKLATIVDGLAEHRHLMLI